MNKNNSNRRIRNQMHTNTGEDVGMNINVDTLMHT